LLIAFVIKRFIMIDKIEKIGFKKVYVEPYCWQFDISGYYFKSDGVTIEWDGEEKRGRKKLNITTIERFINLIECLTERRLNVL